jgi:hypothetical protein
MERKRSRRHGHASAALVAVALALGARPALPVTPVGQAGVPLDGACVEAANGSFDQAFAGWSLDPFDGAFGAAFASSGARIADATAFGGDERAAALDLVLDASWSAAWPTGIAAQAHIGLHRTLIALGRWLELRTGGSFEATIFAHLSYRTSATLRLSDGAGHSAEIPLIVDAFDARLPCLPGTQGTGVFPTGRLSIDLSAHGFTVGRPVSVTILLSASLTALDECDRGTYVASLFVDDVRTCVTPSGSLAVARRPLTWSPAR